jgi:DNA processing protein
MRDKLAAWLCLKTAPQLKLFLLLPLLERFPDPAAFVGVHDHPVYAEGSLPRPAAEHLAQGVLPANFEQILKLCQHYEIRLLCLSDPGYPTGLRNIYSPPLVLYFRGDLPSALQHVSLAVVGTRKPTAYGREMCGRLVGPACRQGVAVISGLAMGIDTVGHQTALKHSAPTIAVLAHGLDQVYPPQNRELALKIVSKGALVSEYEPSSKMERWNFPARNRIVSALAQAVFIVEGSMTSGAMLTAKYAVEQNRDVMALPGNINHPNAQGPNYLIKTGAQCITTPEDILSALGLDAEVRDQLEAIPELSADEQAVYDLFRDAQRELCFDELLLKTGHSFGKLSTLLLNLELKGCIAKSGGNSFILG